MSMFSLCTLETNVVQTKVVLDNTPIGSSFGKVLSQPSSCSKGSTVVTRFQAAVPRVSEIADIEYYEVLKSLF